MLINLIKSISWVLFDQRLWVVFMWSGSGRIHHIEVVGRGMFNTLYVLPGCSKWLYTIVTWNAWGVHKSHWHLCRHWGKLPHELPALGLPGSTITGFHPTSVQWSSNLVLEPVTAWFWCCADVGSSSWPWSCRREHCPAGTHSYVDAQRRARIEFIRSG